MDSVVSSIKEGFIAIGNIVENILTGLKELFITLFVPSEDFWNDFLKPFLELEKSALYYSNLFKEFSKIIEATMQENITGPPDFTVELWGAKCVLVNWDIIAPYRPLVHSLVIALVYGKFLFWLLHKVSCVIYSD